MGIIAGAGIWRSTFKGEDELDPNYCLGFEAKEVDGKITAEVRLNPKAVFNDGTPVDIEAIRAAWTVYRNPDDGYNVIATPFWQQVASIDPVDGDKTRVKIVMTKPMYPAETLGLLGLHPRTDRQGALQQRLREQAHGSVLVRPLQDW